MTRTALRWHHLSIALATTLFGAMVQIAPASAQQVSGTYLRTCRNVQVSNGLLTAECADRDGRARVSSIPYRRCNGDIGNNNGLLNCNGASATEMRPGGPGGPGPGPGFDDRERPSVFAEFQGIEHKIRINILDGMRSRQISRDDGRDLLQRLSDIQDREQRVYDRNHRLSGNDRSRFRQDLDQLDRLVDRARRR